MQGWVGLAVVLRCCALGALWNHLVIAVIYNPTKRDRYFAFSLLGIFIGLLVTIFTVFLGNQPYELFFLLLGWSQAVRVRRRANSRSSRLSRFTPDMQCLLTHAARRDMDGFLGDGRPDAVERSPVPKLLASPKSPDRP